MKKKYKWIFFLIGAAGIALLVIRANPDGMDWREMFTPWLPLLIAGLLALWGVIYAVHAHVYRMIMGEDGRRIGKWELFRIVLAGFALNNVTPAGLVGGEPFRIMALKKYLPEGKAASSTITFSMLYVAGHMMLWLTGIALYFAYGCRGSLYVTLFLLLSALFLITVCIIFLKLRDRGIAGPVMKFLSRMPLVGKKAAAYAQEKAELLSLVDECYVSFFLDRKQVVPALLAEYAARLLESAEYFVIFLYLGVNVHVAGGILILTLASLVGNILFIIPLQAGTREGGMVMALEIMRVAPGLGIMGALIYRIRDILCTVLGVLCILLPSSSGSRQ